MTYIDAYGDLFDDEDVYPCVLEYLIHNCPHYANLSNDEMENLDINSVDELALYWEQRMNI
jgi:hypothetical protein